MFKWFRKNNVVLPFNDNEEAFVHACTLGYQPLLGALLPALVVKEGSLGDDGERTFLIRLAVAEGGIKLWSCTLKGAPGYPAVGDLVGFRIVTIASDLPADASLIGFIACRLDSVFVENKGWIISQNYTPPNLKPALHL